MTSIIVIVSVQEPYLVNNRLSGLNGKNYSVFVSTKSNIVIVSVQELYFFNNRFFGVNGKNFSVFVSTR